MVRLALLLLLFALPASASALAPGQLFGAGDQSYFGMFEDPRYLALKPTVARYIVNYDVALKPSIDRDRLDAWYLAATSARQKPMIAFSKFGSRTPPSTAAFSKAFRAMIARYPAAEWAVWNEANHNTQPLARYPKRAAEYYVEARKRCARCKIVGLTVVLNGNYNRYVDRFRAALPKRMRDRVIYGVHNYGDANRRTDRMLVKFLKHNKRGDVWLTETAAWAKFADPWPYDLRRQAEATKYVFSAAKKHRKRVKRVYWYQALGAGPLHRWDSGLFNPDGTTRPSYDVVKRLRFA